MRVLVCGGRDMADASLVFETLDRLNAETRIDVIIEGGAPGADHLAFHWALEKSKTGQPTGSESYEADWKKLGRAAGPIRNQKMIDSSRPDLVVAFPGGRGTADLVTRAKKAGVRVIEIDPRTTSAKGGT